MMVRRRSERITKNVAPRKIRPPINDSIPPWHCRFPGKVQCGCFPLGQLRGNVPNPIHDTVAIGDDFRSFSQGTSMVANPVQSVQSAGIVRLLCRSRSVGSPWSTRMIARFIGVAGACKIFALVSAIALAAEPIAPSTVLRPFDQKDLRTEFTTWLKKSGTADPDHVFRLEQGVLRCGDEDIGYVATRQAYKDYHLSVEYRWGRRNPNDKFVRNSGLLLHGVGPDGSQNGVWMTSIECQLAQGCEGDLILIKGKTAEGTPFPASITSNTVVATDGKTRWQKDGARTVYSGRQFWWSRHQPNFQELIDTRGENDVASPLGEWTRVEAICQAAKITIKVNGTTVNECYDANPAAGKILLQSEGHEVFFRNLEIRPLQAP